MPPKPRPRKPSRERLSRDDLLGAIAGKTQAYPGSARREAFRARITLVLLALFFLLHALAMAALVALSLLGRYDPAQGQLLFQLTSAWGILVGAAVGFYVRHDPPWEDA